ncbi:MAG: copper transporter [Ornithinibacter sp.]
MIDFRYHIVSIVSIFLALAVGIVLGAGPLRGELGTTLAKEVSGLRADKTALNQQVADAQKATEARDGYIGETNPLVLTGALNERTVALVILPGADTKTTQATEATLRSSGAAVVSTTTVNDDWVSADKSKAAARDEAVTAVATSTGVDVTSTGAVSPRDVLLAELLTRPAGGVTDQLDAMSAASGMSALSDAGLVDIDTEGFERADLVVVTGGKVTNGTDEDQEVGKRWVDVVVALDAHSSGVVAAGDLEVGATGDGTLVGALRNDATAVEMVSTVDDSGSPMGQASIVNGLVQQGGGGVGHFGLAAGADAPFAPLPAS